jgi:ATP-dependent Zn protease
MFALVGVIMLSMSSCTKSIKDDIKELQNRVTSTEEAINLLKTQLGKPVTNVTLGADKQTVTVAFSDGTSTSFKVEVPASDIKLPEFTKNGDYTSRNYITERSRKATANNENIHSLTYISNSLYH